MIEACFKVFQLDLSFHESDEELNSQDSSSDFENFVFIDFSSDESVCSVRDTLTEFFQSFDEAFISISEKYH